jgi:3-oxoacyl-[acyl-carrier protein] reductase
MDLGLKDKVALVTGASRGLGRAIATALAREGALLSICARSEAPLTAFAQSLEADGARVLAQAADVADHARMKAWVEATMHHFGGIDLLINNAGVANVGTLAELPEAVWQDSFAVNFFGPVNLARMVSPEIERRGGGAIINVASIYGREAGGPIAYNAAKAALISFTKMLARELAPKQIRVNAVAPGSILYPGGVWERVFHANPAFERDFISHDFPAGRLGTPDEVAYAVVMLASPRASWITGVSLPVDGAQGRSLI